MSYIIHSKKEEDGSEPNYSRAAKTDDLVISEDLRSVYRIHKDGSRRRIKDAGVVATCVNKVKEFQAAEAEKNAANDLQSQQIAATLRTHPRPKLSPAVAALLVGGLAGLPGLPGRSGPMAALGFPEGAAR